MVYVPEGMEVRYRVWRAEPEMETNAGGPALNSILKHFFCQGADHDFTTGTLSFFELSKQSCTSNFKPSSRFCR